MKQTFTNAHSHIFTVKHAPDYFLKTAIHNTAMAEIVERMVQTKVTGAILTGVHWLFGKILYPHKREAVNRYIEFVKMGTAATQKDIFDAISKTYTKYGDYKIIVLTQVFDYLDLDRQSNHIKVQTQVEQVAELKRNALYQNNLFPFLGLDPRQAGINLMTEWVQKYINKDLGFYGIKIYPAYGFFPFDKRLDPIWAWAEANEVPVMTHCTRGGSYYLGTFDSIFNNNVLDLSDYDPNDPYVNKIIERLTNLINDTSIHKNNHYWCNVFGHPDNYRLILSKYPKLKICLAHLGGSNEVIRSQAADKSDKDYPSYLQDNWFVEVVQLMKDFTNVYSDISYTLSDKNAMDIITKIFSDKLLVDLNANPLINKLMYGTDFYLTQQEEFGDEPSLQNIFANKFQQADVNKLAYENPTNYLNSKIHL